MADMTRKGSENESEGRTTDRNDGALEACLLEITSLPELDSEDQKRLWAEGESSEASLREALAEVPETAGRLLRLWSEYQARGLVTGNLYGWHRGGSDSDCSALIDAALEGVAEALARLEDFSDKRLDRVAADAARSKHAVV